MDFIELTAKPRQLERIRRAIELLHLGMTRIQSAPAGDIRANRVAGEIVLLFWNLRRSGFADAASEAAVQGLLDLAGQRLRSPTLTPDLLWRPTRTGMLAIATALLSGLGRADPKFDRIARAAWRLPFVDSSERSSAQRLEAAWCASKLGIVAPPQQASPDSPLDSLLDSLLARPIRPLLMSTADQHAYTRSVFFATDFGHAPPPAELDTGNIWAAIEGGLLSSLLHYDFDLLGEFLLAGFYSKLPATPIFAIGLCALLLTWDDNGFVPDKEPDAVETDDVRAFFSLYHANLVGALVSQELLGRHRKLPAAPPLAAGKAVCRALANALSLLPQAPAADGRLDCNHRFGSARSLLETILGSRVTTRLAAVVGDATMAQAFPDLLITYGLVHRDLEAVLAGAQKSLPSDHLSPTAACAAEWLLMAVDMLEAGQDNHILETAATHRLLQSLRVKISAAL